MNPFNESDLQPNKRVIELTEEQVVAVGNGGAHWVGEICRANRNKSVAKTTALTVATIGMLAIPIASFFVSKGEPLSMLQMFNGTESPPRNTASPVFAVDTSGISIRSKNVSPTTKELFEQAAVKHFAKIHQTYSSWAERNQELMGSLLLKLTIDSAGTVVRADPLASHLTNSDFTKTVLAEVREWKFPEGTAEAVEITVPLLFIPKGMNPDTVVQWERKIRSAQRGETSVTGVPITNKTTIPKKSELLRNSSPSLAHADHTNTTKGSTVRIPKPKTEEIALIAVKTNRPLPIRENPRFSAKSVYEVDEAAQLNILENKGDWLKVKVADAGLIGFVRKEHVSPIN